MEYLPRADISRFVLLTLFWLCPVSSWAQDTTVRCMPFVGERLQFSIDWEFINAGIADMRVENTNDGYRINIHAKSNRVLDLFHKTRDTITSKGVCRTQHMQSTLFEVLQNEGRYHSKKHVRFLWQKNIVMHTQNNKTDSYNVTAGHLNAIDAFFAVRKMKLIPGTKIHIPLFDSRKQYMLEVSILKTARLLAPWGETIECLIIEPKLKTKGIFSSKGKIKIWLTNDARHIPLKMTAKIKFGRVVARLRRYENTNDMTNNVKIRR